MNYFSTVSVLPIIHLVSMPQYGGAVGVLGEMLSILAT